METITLPSNVSFTEVDGNRATLTMEPLFPGYGTTIGNAFRRVLLSSIPGAAITAARIKGVDHEFSAIAGVKETMLDVVLNLKGVAVERDSKEPITLTLSAKGKKKVTAGDITLSTGVKIANPEHVIATLTSADATLDMELVVETGIGYEPTENREDEKAEVGWIMIDAVFSPIVRVSMKNERTRVGQTTNYDKVTVEIETNGTMSPEDAVHQAADILNQHFALLVGAKRQALPVIGAQKAEGTAVVAAATGEVPAGEQGMPIEELQLATRTLNALHAAGVRTINDLVARTEDELLALDGFGETSLADVHRGLTTQGLTLKSSL